MNKKRMLGAIITIAFVGIGIYFLFKNIELKKVEDEYQDYTPQEEISDENSQQTKIILYFKNENDELEKEIRVINANILLKEPEKQLINYLIKGPQNNNLQKLIPDGTRLNEIKIEKNCAIINFSNEILNYKDENEKLKIINSISFSYLYLLIVTLTNLKEINSIKILVNGSENENFSDEYLRIK